MLFSLAITLVVSPLIQVPSGLEIFSNDGLMVTIQQIMVGLISGFVLQITFAAVVFGGQAVAYGMGLGFASMVDPQDGQQVPVIAQFYVVITTFLFLVMNAHLLIIEMLVDSFKTIPIGLDSFDKADLWMLIEWSRQLFSVGLLLSLPMIASLLFVNISFGVATRAAPQLQIFSVGFPVTIALGLFLMWLTLPDVASFISDDMLTDAYEFIGQLLKL